MNELTLCKIKIFIFAMGLWLPALTGCAVGPDYHTPHLNTPAKWIGTTDTQSVRLSDWWRTFHDPELTLLVQEAFVANLDVQLAKARLRESRATAGMVAGGQWPAVSASTSYQRTRTPASSSTSEINEDLFQAGFDAIWEMDIFGGIRRNLESAGADIQVEQEGLRDVQVSLAAEVARNYIQLRGFQQQILVAEENLKAEQRTAEITRQKQQAGFVSTLDVANADTQAATTRSKIPVLQVSARQAIYALSVLLARQPAALLDELSVSKPLPVTPPEVPVGLPSDLLRRRPDIRQVEAQLHAATARIGVATADLFPKLSLTGSLGWQSNLLHSWFSNSNLASSFGPSIGWAIFQGGTIRSNIQVQEALRDQAFLTYKKTVLTALQDVETALFAYKKEWEHRQALQEAVISSRKALAVAMQLYSAGQTDFLNVLQARTTLYVSQDAFVQSNSNICQDLIALYKGLGGGWEV